MPTQDVALTRYFADWPDPRIGGCLHLVSAWATQNRLILGQQAVADGSHEIAAIPELLRVLDLAGALVTIDAAGCQLEIARQIRAQGGDYRLAVKGNQPTLEAAVQAVLDRACEADFEGFRYDTHGSVESGPGRQEERYVTVIYDPEGLPAEFQFDAPLPIGSGSANAAAAPIFSRHSRPFLVHREVRSPVPGSAACWIPRRPPT